ncbi:MAG TPA: FtsQ-type POTRA domain-containing protein, partial [Desulfosarcina sp.]|nr:FtsQ-type POTRA domain-containing protein [Desulfosarcina sp.]
MAHATRKNRFKKNRQDDRLRLRRRIGAIGRAFGFVTALLAASAVFILAHDYFTQSGHFQARRIEVTGNRRLTHQQVLDIGRIGLQTNILSVNLAVTRKRLLADPWIAEATVSRQIPSGLHLQILEETPLAVLDMGSGEELLINVAGRVFERRASSEASEWPCVRGLDHGDLPVGGQPGT